MGGVPVVSVVEALCYCASRAAAGCRGQLDARVDYPFAHLNLNLKPYPGETFGGRLASDGKLPLVGALVGKSESRRSSRRTVG